jgi:hypothetical protein
MHVLWSPIQVLPEKDDFTGYPGVLDSYRNHVLSECMLVGHPFESCLMKMTSLVTLVRWIAIEIMFSENAYW